MNSTTRLSARAKYLFDLTGFIVVRGVLSAAEVEAANKAIDKRAASLCPRTDAALRNAVPGTVLAGDKPRMDLGGVLEWTDEGLPFRSLLHHPALVPYFHELLGPGYRLDHLPLLIAQDQGSEGFRLHGGPLNSRGEMNQHLQYICKSDRIFTTLLAVSVALVDTNKGDGGFCVLPGSHKANFPAPDALLDGESSDFQDFIHVPETRAGDVVLFSEATVHGALPWCSERQRRLVIYRFAPSNLAYGRSYAPSWPPAMLEGMSPEQRAVLEPPYNNRLDRPRLNDRGELIAAESRSAVKKAFDEQVFSTKYF